MTSVVGDNAVIDWVAPDANGSPITSYDIYVKTSTGSFLADAHCDGTAPTVVRDKQCSIPLLTLQVSTTFALSQGDLIEAYIVARNFYGPSGNSNTGNGGTILRVPFPPVSISNNQAVTSATQIAITWLDGTQNGGATVQDYQVSYD